MTVNEAEEKEYMIDMVDFSTVQIMNGNEVIELEWKDRFINTKDTLLKGYK